jgi:hypothetical protein
VTDTSECCEASPTADGFQPNSWLWLAYFGLNLANQAVYQTPKLVPRRSGCLGCYSNEIPTGSQLTTAGAKKGSQLAFNTVSLHRSTHLAANGIANMGIF